MLKNRKFFPRVVIVATLVIIFVLLAIFVEPLEVPLEITFMPQSVSFVLEREISFSGRFDATMQIPIPQNTSYQRIFVEQIRGPAHTTVDDFTKLWKWNIRDSDTIIVIEYRGISYAKVWKQHSLSGVEEIPENYIRKYTSEQYVFSGGEKKYVITPNSSEIRNLSIKITSNYTSVVDKLRAIHSYISTNFYYEKSEDDIKSALEVLKKGCGDCDELSFLYVSLARAVGIPAWMVYGLLYDGTRWSHHAWTRSYVPSIGEVDFDITLDLKSTKFVGFMTKSPYHIEIWEDNGSSEDLSCMYKFITYSGALRVSDICITKQMLQSHRNVIISNSLLIAKEYSLIIFGIILMVVYFNIRVK